MPPTETPSQHARALVSGAYDTHIHVAPDLIARRTDDVTLAHRFQELGLAGFVLKSHFVPTYERAAVVRAAVPACDALGSITLNASVGGINPLAVDLAARGGARIVWFPSLNQDDLRDFDLHAPPVPILNHDGTVTDDVRAVLQVIARHDIALATSHLSAAEIVAVVTAAADEGVTRIVVTHPEFPAQRLPVPTQRALAARGALLERTFTTPHTGRVTWDELFHNTRAVDPEHSILASDLGQTSNPPVEDGLALLADRFLQAGFTDDEVHTMAVRNSRRLIGGWVARDS